MKIGGSLFHTELVTVSCEAGDIYKVTLEIEEVLRQILPYLYLNHGYGIFQHTNEIFSG